MRAGAIQSEVYQSASEFTLETYCLGNNTQLTNFISASNEGQWVVKNTSTDRDSGITLVADVETYKKSMLLKVRRGPREKL